MKPCQLENRSLLLTFEHLTNNIVNVRCYVLNQTTVVPKYYVHMTNVSVTFGHADSFLGRQTSSPMLNYLCVYVKCTSVKLCVHGREGGCSHTVRSGLAPSSVVLGYGVSNPLLPFLLHMPFIRGVNTPSYPFEFRAQGGHCLMLPNRIVQWRPSSHFTCYSFAAIINDTWMRRCVLTSLLTWGSAWAHWIRATPPG